VATAHNRARMGYHLLWHRLPLGDLRPADDAPQAREREMATLRNKATRLGLRVVESPV
jgi:hypothetical protein